ncbi:hypothetical protein [Paracoccus sp. (in: a-proteobacteria)]|uniref:hypothetical protein n=1 Tax=Paracoccus sp. TaxID=267 RepID=UPI0034CD5627
MNATARNEAEIAIQPEWIAGFGGGLLIGLVGALYLLGNARITGGSGLLGGIIDGSGRGNPAERLRSLTALIAVRALMLAAGLDAASAPVPGAGVLVFFAAMCVSVTLFKVMRDR